eukprot:TRINITY_DN37749_c0_g1_i1.p1 TRINITY_DN37749_c0_g1~~TRINITY_DN37749_c0_g1_i1.p1  ORF type:complete len:206 (+),score=37.33 TRINITY_DN37749_c0_g1_i1:114-731(+)
MSSRRHSDDPWRSLMMTVEAFFGGGCCWNRREGDDCGVVQQQLSPVRFQPTGVRPPLAQLPPASPISPRLLRHAEPGMAMKAPPSVRAAAHLPGYCSVPGPLPPGRQAPSHGRFVPPPHMSEPCEEEGQHLLRPAVVPPLRMNDVIFPVNCSPRAGTCFKTDDWNAWMVPWNQAASSVASSSVCTPFSSVHPTPELQSRALRGHA